jgi:DNA polymerase-1
MAEAFTIVDALNFIFRAYHALPPLTTSRGLPTGAVYGLCTMLQKLEREFVPSHLLVVFDAPGPNFRHEIFTGYKADRPPMPPDLAKQIEILHRVISVFQIPTLSLPDVEADDVIATLAIRAAHEGHKVIIASSDKDLMQLCSLDIQLLDTMKGRLLGPAEVEEKFGVPPHLVGDVLALMGDGIDNVPGVEGIGPKTAAELIRRFGSLEALLQNSAEVKGKRGEALRAAHETVRISRRLVDLKCDVALPLPTEAYRRGSPDMAARYALFRELEFFRLIPQDASINVIAAPPQAAAPPPRAAAPMQASLIFDAPKPSTPTAGVFSENQFEEDTSNDVGNDPAADVAPSPDLPPAPPAPAPHVAIVRDSAGLVALIEQVKTSGFCALAVLSEGREATRADFVGFGFALRDGTRHYLPVGHLVLGEPSTLRAPEALALLAPLLADSTVDKVVHDGKFLEVMLAQRGLRVAGVGHDIMLGAYILDASRSRYDLDILAGALGRNDVTPRAALLGSGKSARLPSQIPVDVAAAQLGAEAAAVLAIADFQRAALKDTGLDRLCDGLERPLARVLAQMESLGILLDVSELARLGTELAAGIGGLEKEIHDLAGTEFNIGSPKQLAEILFTKLGLPVIRRTKTGPSTDADVLEALAAEHPVPAKIVEYRGLTKLKNTYVDALPLLVHPRTGRLHTTFNQAVAATGRLSSSEPNLQNIPIRTELGRRIRQAFVADPGHMLVSADYSQIELRILAHFSEDPAFLEAFRAGQDIHQRTAAEVFGVPLDSVSSEQRRIAKAINFGLVFGQSDFGLAQAVGITRAAAKTYITSYFERYAGVRAYMERSIADARATGASITLLGRRRVIPEINSKRPQERNHAERVARNTPIQGSAADILKLAMIEVAAGMTAQWPSVRLLLTVHDELVFEVGAAEVEGFSAWVKSVMQSVVKLQVPLVVDVGAGPTWGAAH